MKILFTLGDPWADGHGKTDQIWIESNKTKKELEDAYEKAQKRFDFAQQVACNYEDDRLMSYDADKFLQWGFDFTQLEQWKKCGEFASIDDIMSEGEVDEDIPLDYYDYMRLLLFHIGMELPHFVWSFTTEELPEFKVGDLLGYGLFS